jgi:RNA polymerase sporulation-specific sigma factor
VRELTQRLGREPRISEIQAETGLQKEDIITATEATKTPISLDLPPEEGGVCPSINSPEEQSIQRILIDQILNSLPPLERKLIVLRYIWDQTQSVTAQELGISQVAVSRLERKIIDRLKEFYNP